MSTRPKIRAASPATTGLSSRIEFTASCCEAALASASDRLDVMHPAAIPLGAEPAATRCGEMVEQVGHWVIRTMRGDEVVAGKGGPPITLAARNEDGLARLISEPIECLLDH